MGKKIHLQNHREEFTPDYYDRITHCEKNVRIRSYSGLHFFPIFPHSDRIQCRKMLEKCGSE